jgi:anthranilate synthase component I
LVAPGLHVEAVSVTDGTLVELAARFPARYPMLLDSAAEGPLACQSILAALPRARLWRDAAGRVASSPGLLADDFRGGFLDALDLLWRREARPPAVGPVPCAFRGGWFVYLGYEIGVEVEPRLAAAVAAHAPVDGRPDAFALRIPAALLRLADGSGLLVAEGDVSAGELAQLRADIAAVGAGAPSATASLPPDLLVEEDPARYLERVRRAQDYIRAGDIYQANLSRPWTAQLPDGFTAADLYRRLRRANPAPFAAFAQFDGFAVLSSSPERLLRVTGGRLDTRPIAGTHPRGQTADDDRALAAALIAHPKERAEHVMLIDLARNDLGRVSVGGSVRVDEYMAVETYAHVHHIVSNVTGELLPGVTPVQALRAVFPGGTITGCPKLRCMEIIAELEGEGRGAYTGSLGYLNHDGDADFNILIRTITLQDGRLVFRAGAGIVADSRPGREVDETRAKARGMRLALQ